MKNRIVISAVVLILSLAAGSCAKFVEIEPPKNSLVPATVFKNNDLANSAILGVYQQMALSEFACNGARSVSALCGLTADELIGYNAQTYRPFYENIVTPENAVLAAIWDSPYKRIYDVNAIIEGLTGGSGVTPSVGAQIKGEAHFVRAFCYFYLINLFGDVPLHLTTDYEQNRSAVRAPKEKIYAQILSDLGIAEQLLADNYVGAERVRPNKAAVWSLLSRVYLFLEDWPNAEKYATLVIDKSATYQLVAPDKVFLKNSPEAIWQLMPAPSSNTPAGAFFILTTAPVNVSLRPDFVQQSFEINDLRKQNWIRSLVSAGTEYFYPYKYRVRVSTDVTEYSMVMRLAELYLNRAEARARQEKFEGAINDIDKIRLRAGLPLIINSNPNVDKVSLLALIQRERNAELFSEWGDRWFTLLRMKNADQVLALSKPGWKSNFHIFPIRLAEINNNNRIAQNPGY